MATTIGELKGIERGIKIEWKIPDFFTFSREANAKYHSPTFPFAGASWYLRIYPNRITDNQSIGSVEIYLMKADSSHSVNVAYEMGLKKIDGKIDSDCSYRKTFTEKDRGQGCGNLITSSRLLERKSFLAPSNVVTVICKLTQDKSNVILSPPFQRRGKLSQDLRELMLNGNGSDLTVKVGKKEFKLHKIILGIRSPDFATMVKTEIDKNNVDIVEIPDCEEPVFTKFLEYVYTGTVTNVAEKDLFGLYEIAEKYEVAEIKEDCLQRIKDLLSIGTFFDTVKLSEKYDEKELQLLVSKFCSDNLKDLVKNPMWMTFMEENTKKAYELLSTALTNYVKS